jgi:hypothetical protein
MSNIEPIMIISSAGSQRHWVDMEKYEAALKVLRSKGMPTLRKGEDSAEGVQPSI